MLVNLDETLSISKSIFNNVTFSPATWNEAWSKLIKLHYANNSNSNPNPSYARKNLVLQSVGINMFRCSYRHFKIYTINCLFAMSSWSWLCMPELNSLRKTINVCFLCYSFQRKSSTLKTFMIYWLIMKSLLWKSASLEPFAMSLLSFQATINPNRGLYYSKNMY